MIDAENDVDVWRVFMPLSCLDNVNMTLITIWYNFGRSYQVNLIVAHHEGLRETA